MADFGDYVSIEMKRYGVKNEHYLHKVIGRLRSNHAAKVPIDSAGTGTKAIPLGEVCDVLNVITCGVDETAVFKVCAADARITPHNPPHRRDT